MSGRWSVAVGLVGAAAGVVVWASDLTLVQGLTEPTKPWHDAWASNNTYWARDLRWMALVAVLAGDGLPAGRGAAGALAVVDGGAVALPGLVLGGLLSVVSRTRRRWVPLTRDRLPA